VRGLKIVEEERINEYGERSLVSFSLFFSILVSSLRIAHAFTPSSLSFQGHTLGEELLFTIINYSLLLK